MHVTSYVPYVHVIYILAFTFNLSVRQCENNAMDLYGLALVVSAVVRLVSLYLAVITSYAGAANAYQRD